MGTYIRCGKSDVVRDFGMICPLPATGEVLVHLDDGAHARHRIIILALHSKCNASHEILRGLYALRTRFGVLRLIPTTKK